MVEYGCFIFCTDYVSSHGPVSIPLPNPPRASLRAERNKVVDRIDLCKHPFYIPNHTARTDYSNNLQHLGKRPIPCRK